MPPAWLPLARSRRYALTSAASPQEPFPMNRLILALAFTPALFSTAALAQTVPDDVAKELWCGSAFVAAFSNPPPGVPSEQLALAQNYIDQGNKMIDDAGQKYLNA